MCCIFAYASQIHCSYFFLATHASVLLSQTRELSFIKRMLACVRVPKFTETSHIKSSVMQSAAVCCSVAVWGRVVPCGAVCGRVLPCVAVRCRVVAVRCHALPCVAVCCRVLPCVAVRCRVLPCVAVCRLALPCVAVYIQFVRVK